MRRFVLSVVALAISSVVHASVVRDDVDYQDFRNFGENKGRFQVGAVNIPIYNKQKQLLGYALPENVPMPDFSAVDSKHHLSGLISYQYISSVKHNSNAHFDGLTFGDGEMRYRMVDRNDHAKLDYNIPRFHKMVYEVAPAELPETLSSDDMFNGRFSAFARAGSGTQAVQDGNNVTVISKPYIYRTGGTSLKMKVPFADLIATVIGDVQDGNTAYSPLVSYAAKGDSGSPLFGYDHKLGRWLLVGNVAQYYGYDTVRNNYILTRNNFLKQTQQDDMQLFNVKSLKPLKWANKQSGETILSSELNEAVVNVKKGTNLNYGKNILFKGNQANIELQDNIDQGAGGLYFFTSGTVSAVNNSITHVGSGVFVDEGETVNWKVKNPSSDRLIKVGKGTLIINGTGENQGHLGVGEGRVVLNQQPDSTGKSKAFSSISIASGRGEVVLNEHQISSLDSVKFGFRGGKLDLNGLNITTANVNHKDDGATLFNGNVDKESILNFNSNKSEIFLGNLGTSLASITERFIPETKEDGIDISDFTNNDGVLHIEKSSKNNLTLTGNTNIKGDFSVNQGTLNVTGAPVIYADKYVNGRPQKVINEQDYFNRTFNARKLIVNSDSIVNVGRNIVSFNADMTVNGSLNLGNNQSELASSIPVTTAYGNLMVGGNGNVNLGKVTLFSTVSGQNNSHLTLGKENTLILMGDSEVGHLNLIEGSQIYLNPNKQFNHFNTFKVLNSLSGKGKFRFSTDLKNLVANQLILKGNVSGSHKIAIEDSGREPTNMQSDLRIFTVEQPNQSYHFELENGHVDAGAYRYVLNNTGTLTVNKTGNIKPVEPSQPESTGLEGVDPNFKKTDFSTLNPAFNDLSLLEKIKAVYAANNNRNLSAEELKSLLRNAGVNISARLDGSDVLLKRYDLTKLTEKDLEELKANGIDLNNIDLSAWTDDTPIPDALKEILLYDRETALSEGLKLDNPTFKPMVNQKEVMSKYANAMVNTATATMFNALQVNSIALPYLIQPTKGAWLTHRYQRFNTHSPLYRDSKHTSNTVHIGGLESFGPIYLGFGFTELRDKMDIADRISGNQVTRLAELFAKYSKNSLFTYSRVGFGKTKHTLSSYDLSSHFNQRILKLGVGLGVNWMFDNAELIPFSEFTYHDLKSSNTQLNGGNATIKDWKSGMLSFGLQGGYNLSIDDQITLKPEFSVIYHHLPKAGNITFNNANFTYEVKNGVESNVGIKLISPKFKFGISGYYTKFKGFNPNKGLNTSLEVTF